MHRPLETMLIYISAMIAHILVAILGQHRVTLMVLGIASWVNGPAHWTSMMFKDARLWHQILKVSDS